MTTIRDLRAQEILDSRGRPTIKVVCTLANGVRGSASVPSGASTGHAEARELRDGDPGRYDGLGCRQAAASVVGPILQAIRGKEWKDQSEVDAFLCAVDGTPDKRRLGANAVLGVSLAYARAAALSSGNPLYQYLALLAGWPMNRLPRLSINLFSGGKHAGGQLAIQDVLIVPLSARTIDDSLAMASRVYQSAITLTAEKYRTRALKADEGGLAPPFPSSEAALADAVEAIVRAGLVPGKDVALAVDVAASHFFENGVYRLDGQNLTSPQLVSRLESWIDRFPIVSIEDGLAEEDWAHWPALCQALSPRCAVMGDDFLCTNPHRIRRAAESNSANALLLKVNQIGTLSEACEAGRLARTYGWQVTVSARSGETEDDWLADLAAAWGDTIKVGSIRQSERLAKYNRLLEIEQETHCPLVDPPQRG